MGAHSTMICGGDMFDVAYPSLEVADDVIDLFAELKWDLASVLGNHDLDGAIASAARTVLGHLMRRGCITLLPPLSSPPLQIGIFDIWGLHWQHNNHNLDLAVNKDRSRVSVVVAHSMILKEDTVFEGYTLYKDINTNADILCLGHYHPSQPITTLNNPDATIVVAPGALMRGCLSTTDLNRSPSLALISATSPTDIKVEYVPIGVAKEGNEVFSVEAKAASIAKEKQLNEFVRSLSFDTAANVDAASIIEQIAKQNNISTEVKNEALSRLGVITNNESLL